MSAPEVTVVVPSHDRPLRLRWLLEALAEQTLPRERFEVIVAHDSRGPETEALLRAHELAGAGVLRHLSFPPGPGPAAKRNAAWREARAPLVVFTDDDCRPPAEWLERVLAAARANPGAVVQGATQPDPDELAVLHASPHSRSQAIDPPGLWAETCNIAYPRELLKRVDGFDESLPVAAGEDTDLAQRALAAGARLAAAPEALTYHAVEDASLPGRMRSAGRWQHLALLVRRHPDVRDQLTLRVFWKPAHAWLPLAVAGALLARRWPLLALLAVPWARATLPDYGSSRRGRARALGELPGRALVDAAEFAALVRGSIRHRTLIL